MSVHKDLPTPSATRLRPPSWRDPRLLAGLLMVVGSVVLASQVVAAADETDPYYVAVRALAPGDAVDPDDVRVVRLTMDAAEATYLPADADLPEGLVAVRAVGEGELVPRSGVGSGDGLQVQPVGVPVSGALASGLVKGALVDVWVADPDPERAGGFLRPERLVERAVVAEVSDSATALGAGGGSTVQVLVEPDALQQVLGALANDASVSLVLAPGQGG